MTFLRMSFALVAALALGLVVQNADAQVDSVETGVIAAGTSQSTCLAVTKQQVIIAGVAAGTGICLPAATSGGHQYVTNYGANPVNVYPAPGAHINDLVPNTPVIVGVGLTALFVSPSLTQWYSVP